MSTTRIIIEKEIDKIDNLIQRAQNEVREAQLFINAKNKSIESWSIQRATMISDLEKMSD
ncbi:hypothetical protein EVB79_077 [Rhizobium phage RHph_N3_13]|nr:hypothetical protein EVB79_077 [Rhizobium phage RHph_N3_13]QIG69903.1 hypothetical protein F67_I3_11_077 [Rhizobium phage RHph_I3_11]